MALKFHSDLVLWTSFKKGDINALDVLFREYYPLLFRYGKKISQDPNLVEDNLQEFFLYLFEHREGLTSPDNLKAYIFKSYRSSLLKELKKNNKSRQKELRDDLLIPNIYFSIDEIIIKQETEDFQKRALVAMLNSLPNRQREVLLHRYYNDLTIKEIAEVMDISYQGVVNAVHKAIKALRSDAYLQRISSFF